MGKTLFYGFWHVHFIGDYLISVCPSSTTAPGPLSYYSPLNKESWFSYHFPPFTFPKYTCLLLRARGFCLSLGDILSWRKKIWTRTTWRITKPTTIPMVRLRDTWEKSQWEDPSVCTTNHRGSGLTEWVPGLTAWSGLSHAVWGEPGSRQTEGQTGSGQNGQSGSLKGNTRDKNF